MASSIVLQYNSVAPTLTAGSFTGPLCDVNGNMLISFSGGVASGSADSGNPVKVAGVYNTNNPSYTTGQRTDLQTVVSGALLVNIGGITTTGADGVSNVNLVAPASTAGGAGRDTPRTGIIVAPLKFNGISWDRERKANLSARVASSAASGNPAFLKGSAGDLYQFWGQNGAAITYVQIYNKATAPTIGTDTPVLTYPVAANAFFTLTLPSGGLYFGTGIAYAFTTDAAATTGASAAAVTSFNILGA